ncbi:MAG TPA: hypothetical protein VMB75_05020, partial [Rhodocyclaceae bacterium]|nr:hypothetical protein [Rhodocyclaceae bacterium]
EMAGMERITVPAGSFETKKVSIVMGLSALLGNNRGSITITVWYSEAHHRVIKQRLVAQGFNGRLNGDEILELAAVRAAGPNRLAAQ